MLYRDGVETNSGGGKRFRVVELPIAADEVAQIHLVRYAFDAFPTDVEQSGVQFRTGITHAIWRMKGNQPIAAADFFTSEFFAVWAIAWSQTSAIDFVVGNRTEFWYPVPLEIAGPQIWAITHTNLTTEFDVRMEIVWTPRKAPAIEVAAIRRQTSIVQSHRE